MHNWNIELRVKAKWLKWAKLMKPALCYSHSSVFIKPSIWLSFLLLTHWKTMVCPLTSKSFKLTTLFFLGTEGVKAAVKVTWYLQDRSFQRVSMEAWNRDLGLCSHEASCRVIWHLTVKKLGLNLVLVLNSWSWFRLASVSQRPPRTCMCEEGRRT